jgi:hypothetical protein
MPAHCRFFALRQEEIALEIALQIAPKIELEFGLKKAVADTALPSPLASS